MSKATYIALSIVSVAIIVGGVLWMNKKPATTVQGILDVLTVETPLANSVITSPLTVKGSARGMFYFEASFPVRVLDANRAELAITPAQAQGEWMTENFVPFIATLTFDKPTTTTGFVVFQKDNPSGLPEHDQKFELPIKF